ncbi:MAG: phosphorylase [Potamolinea sp.]
MSNLHPIQTILVPQGSEYKAVCRGLMHLKSPKPLVLPIPIGSKPLISYLKNLQQTGEFPKDSQPKVLLMGLCGSLSPDYQIGDIVVYKECIYHSNNSTPWLQLCDTEVTKLLSDQLKDKASLVRGLTSDRLIYSASKKQHLGQIYNTEVVDMEGFAALETLTKARIAVAMLRVVSDDSEHNLPNLNSAINTDGKLELFPLAMGMMRQPIAATRLIRGALQGLRMLQKVTTLLFIEK